MKLKILLILSFLILFISCGTKIDVNKIREYADPMTENLLIGRNEGNHENKW